MGNLWAIFYPKKQKQNYFTFLKKVNLMWVFWMDISSTTAHILKTTLSSQFRSF